jgi:predicted GNAT family N-acyltransferase
LYEKAYGHACHHVLAREDGRIKALVGVFPVDVSVGGKRLRTCGIGMVAVHPYSRHSGYMKTLMAMADQAMRDSGAQFACLSGQRQRYQYSGFEKCGLRVLAQVNESNIRHRFGSGYSSRISFGALTSQSPELPVCRDIYSRRIVHAERDPSRFFDTLRTWDSDSWIIRRENSILGYLCADKKGEGIGEFVLTAEASRLNGDQAEILAAWLAHRNIPSVKVHLSPWVQGDIASLSIFAEQIRMDVDQNFCVYDFNRTIEAFFAVKSSYTPLPEGSLVLGIEGRGSIRISFADGRIKSEATEEPANLFLPYLGAMEFFFGHLRVVAPGLAETLGRPGPALWTGKERELAGAWFPLPLAMDEQDMV